MQRFQGKNFVNSIDYSIFPSNADAIPKKNDNGVEEDNENDDESSISDCDRDVVEDFEVNESASPEEFSPLAS